MQAAEKSNQRIFDAVGVDVTNVLDRTYKLLSERPLETWFGEIANEEKDEANE